MMRALSLLALLGAVPAPSDISAAASCALPRAQVETAFRALPLVSTEDDTEADERGTIYTFKDATLWGQPARRITFSDYANSNAGEYSQRFETAFPGDYETVLARFLTVHGKKECDQKSDGICVVTLGLNDGWSGSVMLGLELTEADDDAALHITCSFTKRR